MKRYLTLILLSVITLNTYAQSEAGYEKKRSPWLFKKHVWFQDKTTFSDTATFEAPVMVQKIVFSDSTEQTTAGNGVSDSDSSSWTYQLLGGIGDQGTILWNTDDETIDLIQNGSTLQIGQEIQLPCINLTGATIPNGKIVMYAGGSGASGNIKVKPYSYPYPPAYIVGVTTYDAPQGAKVKVTTFGKIRNFDTELIYGTLTDSIIYVDSTGNYTYEPDPDFIVPIGTLVSNETASGANNGTISIRFIPLNYAKVDHGELAYKWGNHANAGYLTAEVDSSITNEIELTTDELAAVNGANSPSSTNVFATINDLSEVSGDSLTLFSLIDVTIGSGSDTNIVLRFNRELSQYTGIGFAVRIDGVQQYIQSWYLDNANDPYFGILINMYGQPIYRESKVEISYTKHTNPAARVKDLAGNELENFGWMGVINNSSTSSGGGSGITIEQAKQAAIDTIANADSVVINGSLRGSVTTESFATSKSINYFLDHTKALTVTGNINITVNGLPWGFYPVLFLPIDATGGYTVTITGATKGKDTNDIDTSSGAKNVIQFLRYADGSYYWLCFQL